MMTAFPQLGMSMAQYPVTVTRSYRTVVNRCQGGSAFFYGDPTAASLAWELSMTGLSDGDWDTLQTFFEACEGRLREFTFLDPTANLLSCSEDLSMEVWQPDPMIQLSKDLPDVLGANGATGILNTGQADQGVVQTLSVPASYRYALSLFARSDSLTTLRLRLASANGLQEETHAVGTDWRRFVLSTTLAASDEEVAFGFNIPPGASAQVCGMQVEAQWGASLYRKTAGSGGVYPRSHFDQDHLARVTDALGSNSTRVKIESVI